MGFSQETCCPFNSTRCIRNGKRSLQWRTTTLLSTPHGALGTGERLTIEEAKLLAFNSTRCIRNIISKMKTPKDYITFNSTRCIRNPFDREFWAEVEKLSTPHGALGTGSEFLQEVRPSHFQLHTVH